MRNQAQTLWPARLLIGLVLISNVQAGIAFLAAPDVYAPNYALSGAGALATVQGMGLLFLMWNIPYAVALSHPRRHFVSLCEALSMQSLGLLGESLIFINLAADQLTLRSSILRFIVFDAAGLFCLLLAFGWVLTRNNQIQ